ncbi:MAG: EAL domain-containing protein [Desulfamplus sp.]|nr:EAL domain-containing protein [Desulfamplus sp.]
MSLRKTTLLIITFCFTILVAILFVTTKKITYNKFETLEDRFILSNLNRSMNAISAIISNLDMLVVDWAFWDDTYQFLQGEKDDFITSNLPIETFSNQNNNIIILLNTKKELVWGKYLAPSGEELLPLPPGTIETVTQFINNPTEPGDKKGFKGIIVSENSIYMAACRPILTSSQEGPYVGWCLMARELEHKTVESLEERIELDLEIAGIGDKEMLETLSNSPLIEKTNDALVCFGIIRDVAGEPAAIISVRASREIFDSGVAVLHMILMAMIITGLFMGGISVFLLEKRVLKRILSLNYQVQSVTKSGNNKGVGISGDDEIASLARSIQEMLVKLQENESFLTQILSSIPAGIVVIDEKSGVVREISRAALRMLDKRYEDVVGTTNIQFLLPYPPEIFDDPEEDSDKNQVLVKSMETILITTNGDEIPVIRSVARIIREGKPMLLEMFLDFTDLHETQKALSESEAKYKTLFMNTGNAAILVAEDTTIRLANQEFIKLAKVSGTELVEGRSWVDFFHPEEISRMSEFHRLRRSAQSHAAPRQYETRFMNYYGEIRFVSLTVAMLPGTTMSVCSILDITDWKKSEQDLAKKAFFDSLTNLPNRQLFHNRLEHALDFARRSKTMVGVFLLDIDDFKNVNDSMGHQSGDKVLQEIAMRLSNRLRRCDTLARLGGDEFTLILQDLEDVGDLCKIADTIIDDFKVPFTINAMEFYLGVSIGISVFPNDGHDAEVLIKNADLAMYQSKQQGKNRYKIFTEELNSKAQRRVALERDLRQAIAAENFEVYYQPKIFIKNGTVYGMEALVRGKRADGTMIPPGEFIPFAEESGLVVPLDMIVLKKACFDTVRWISHNNSPNNKSNPSDNNRQRDKNSHDNPINQKNKNGSNLVVSVNISTRHFHIKGFVESVEEILKQTGLPPSSLELEVTETALMKDISQAMNSIEQLSRLGISFSLDDFGTGYSSLYYLSNLPFQTLKIDKSFIDNICDEKESSSELVKIIISLAGNMNMKVVAEGVETKEQLDRLRFLGCDQAQGYFISKPISAEQFESFLLSSKSVRGIK